jgi:putative FmdB family regulatory protein
MPVYQFYCNECGAPYEIMMSLAELDEYDTTDNEIDCPNCGESLNKLICPARLSSSRCTL